MNTPTAGRWAIAAVTIAVAYLLGGGGWSTPTTAVGTVAHTSSERAEPIRVVVEVAPQPVTAAPRTDTTELAALLAAEDELAERSATVVARATERAEQKAATPAKAAPAKTVSATAPAKVKQKAEKAAEKATAKSSKAKAPGAVKAPSNAELAYRIEQLAEDTCERRAGGVVAEDYTCVGADFHSKPTTPKVKAQGKAPAANADTVPLGEGKARCPSGYSRDKADRSLCVAKS